MAKKNNIGLGLAALAVGAGAVAAVTKGHKAEVKKEERKAAVKAAKKDYRNTELGRYDKNSKGIYYSNGNYEAFARPKKPTGVDEKNAYIVGSGLASLAAACFLVRDGQMPGSHIHILEAMDIAGGACDGIFDPARGYVMRGGREMENHFECLVSSSIAVTSCRYVAYRFFGYDVLVTHITSGAIQVKAIPSSLVAFTRNGDFLAGF